MARILPLIAVSLAALPWLAACSSAPAAAPEPTAAPAVSPTAPNNARAEREARLAANGVPRWLCGAVVPMITPYKGANCEELDLPAMARFTDYLCSTRASGLFCNAGMGQWQLLSVAEKKAVIDTVVKSAARRKAVLAGVGSDHTIDEALDVARHAERAGADAVVVVTPSFIRREQEVDAEGHRRITDQEVLYQYFARVAPVVTIPVVIYDPEPEVAPATMARLVKAFPNVKGMKFRETKDMEVFGRMVAAVEGRAAILSGSEYETVRTFKVGAVGVIGGGPNVYADLVADLVEACAAGDWPKADLLQARVKEACDTISRAGGVKAILSDVIGVSMDTRNRGEKPKPDDEKSRADRAKALDYFRAMNLPKYAPRAAGRQGS
ncbi:MAG: dihydrodipicolinate synthase family protein [Planctomycetes bacterium]|nr:dihydrodipicolinate synthase family protein [Planctomycetota bacterium]